VAGVSRVTTTSVAQVRLSHGSIVANDVAMQMTDPGDNFANIFVMISSNSAANWTTDVVGNTTARTAARWAPTTAPVPRLGSARGPDSAATRRQGPQPRCSS
jgi:hypothetical protein